MRYVCFALLLAMATVVFLFRSGVHCATTKPLVRG